ncbi:hypothetical protein LCGC14_0581670 [marine sediment metagenome]|uniref:YprB ribonuclease H-like domain-containing protein n=1 Tax=marine sediment metagenome TaxID=412755 RepID=A0A0F9RZV9_9ZZZZ
MSTNPMIWCWYDRCCQFTPGSHNAKYCSDHKCKRKAENSAKRLTEPGPSDPETLWGLQERRKLHNLDNSQAKNAWLLDKSKIGFFDIESSNLDANIGLILCACVKDRNGEVHTWVAGRDEQGIIDDHQAVVAMRDYLESLDYVCTYYGTKFDIPFVNTRLIIHGERPINQIRHIDLYYTARFKLKMHSNRLVVLLETLFGESEKTRVVGPIWVRALAGDQESVAYIVDHCQIDVETLGQAFEKLKGFINLSASRWRRYGASY